MVTVEQNKLLKQTVYDAALTVLETKWPMPTTVILATKIAEAILRQAASQGSPDEDRNKRLAETVELIGRALEAGRATASIFPLDKDALPQAVETIEKRRALLNTACYEFRTTFKHDLAASQGSAGGETAIEWIARTQAPFHDALIKYPDAFEALHFLWNSIPDAALSPPVKTGCGDPSCRDPNCTYGQGPNLDPISDPVKTGGEAAVAQASPKPEDLWECSGCGTRKSMEQIKAEHPNAWSCCPERKMGPAIPSASRGTEA